MWHRYLINGLAAQYLNYISWLFVVGACFLFLPSLLAGYGSGLALLISRIAAIAALVTTLPFLVLNRSGFFRGTFKLILFLSFLPLS